MISRKLTKWQELQDVLLDGTTQINDDDSGKLNNYASQLSQIVKLQGSLLDRLPLMENLFSEMSDFQEVNAATIHEEFHISTEEL